MSKHLAFLLVLLSLFLTSCFKQNIGPQGPAGPAYTGVISGHVWLYDQYGTRIDTGLAGVQVTIRGSLKDTTITSDSNGTYIFTNIITGNYTISAHVPNNGYADTKIPNFQFISDTLNRDVKMSAIPNFAPDSISALLAATPNDSLIISFSADTRVRSYIIFVNNTSTVNGLPGNYRLSYVRNLPANQTKATILIPAGDLHDADINSGALAHYAVYGYAVNDASVYEDITSGKYVYGAISSTAVTDSVSAP